MGVQSFKCPKCGKFTRHINFGLQGGLNAEIRRDKTKNLGIKLFANVMGGVADHIGATKIIGDVILGKGTYKCCECGLVADWNNDGTMDGGIY